MPTTESNVKNRPSPERIAEAMALLYQLTLKRELGVDAKVEVSVWNGSEC